MMNIAIVEDFVFDQKHLIDLIQKNFEEHGEMADFTCYESGESFLEAFRPGLFNAVFMDIMIQAVLGQGQSSCQRILLDDFLYAETQNHRLIIHTLKGDVATRLSFSDLMALLPKGGRFYMSGRSLLLNFSQVISVEEDGSVRLKNGSCLFCSRRKKKETREAFMSYLFTCMRKGMITDE